MHAAVGSVPLLARNAAVTVARRGLAQPATHGTSAIRRVVPPDFRCVSWPANTAGTASLRRGSDRGAAWRRGPASSRETERCCRVPPSSVVTSCRQTNSMGRLFDDPNAPRCSGRIHPTGAALYFTAACGCRQPSFGHSVAWDRQVPQPRMDRPVDDPPTSAKLDRSGLRAHLVWQFHWYRRWRVGGRGNPHVLRAQYQVSRGIGVLAPRGARALFADPSPSARPHAPMRMRHANRLLLWVGLD
jgi:hypothetical protein